VAVPETAVTAANVRVGGLHYPGACGELSRRTVSGEGLDVP